MNTMKTLSLLCCMVGMLAATAGIASAAPIPWDAVTVDIPAGFFTNTEDPPQIGRPLITSITVGGKTFEAGALSFGVSNGDTGAFNPNTIGPYSDTDVFLGPLNANGTPNAIDDLFTYTDLFNADSFTTDFTGFSDGGFLDKNGTGVPDFFIAESTGHKDVQVRATFSLDNGVTTQVGNVAVFSNSNWFTSGQYVAYAAGGQGSQQELVGMAFNVTDLLDGIGNPLPSNALITQVELVGDGGIHTQTFGVFQTSGPVPGIFFTNLDVAEPGLVFDTTNNTIFINGTDANATGHVAADGSDVLGPGSYVGSGSTTYTFDAGKLSGTGAFVTFDKSINSVSKVGTNPIAFVVPGDMQVGTDLSPLGSIDLDVGTTNGTGTPTDGTLNIFSGGVLSVSNAVGLYQLKSNGTLNNSGSLTSANTSTTNGQFAYELGSATVNVALGGTGGVNVTGPTTLNVANTYTGITRISTGGALKTTVADGIDASSAGLEFAGGTLVVDTATLNVTLGTGAGEANFVVGDDRNTRIGGGYAAAGQDTVLTFNGGATLKYASTPGWFGVGAGGTDNGFGRSSQLGLNNSSLATNTIELTNNLDLNSVSGNNNVRGITVGAGQTAIFSGDILDTGPGKNNADVDQRAVFAVSGGTLRLTGSASAGGFNGTFAGGGVQFTGDDYFANTVRWRITGSAPIPGPANEFGTSGDVDLNGTTQHAASADLRTSVSSGTLNASGDIFVGPGGGEITTNLVAGGDLIFSSDGDIPTIFGDNSAGGTVFLGGDDDGDPNGVFLIVGNDNALGQPGTTAEVDVATVTLNQDPPDNRLVGISNEGRVKARIFR